MTNRAIGNMVMTLCGFVAAGLCFVSLLFPRAVTLSGDMGLCLPSPDIWQLPSLVSWLLNTLLIAILAIGTALLNRTFNFIQTPRSLLPAIFVILVSSNPWITHHLSESTLLCAANILSLGLLFSVWQSPNATRVMFIVATLFSIGSMFQYAFLPMMVSCLASSFYMKIFRPKEIIAFLMGVIAPYWIVLGLGIIPLDNLHLWDITPFFSLIDDNAKAADFLLLLLNVGTAAFIGIILGVSNSVKLYAGNSQVNAMNLCISVMGVVSAICMIVDFNNMPAYIATLYLAVAVQISQLSVLWKIRQDWMVITVTAVIFIGFFVIDLLV